MPHEKINDARTSEEKQLEVAWNKIGWVQLSTHEQAWENTGEWSTIDLVPADIDKLIKVLKKAKRQAYADGARHYGFADAATVTVSVDGRPFSINTARGRMTTADQILSASGLNPSEYDLGRVTDGQMYRQTKANAFVIDGTEDYVSIRISTMSA